MPENNNTGNDRALLARLDERTLNIQSQNEELRLKLIKLEEKLEKSYVSKEEFNPFQRVIYSAVGLIFSIFFAVIASQVFHATPLGH